ncbi:class I SAM-dependent methyltransferase [Lysobacter sp. GCM10012299]|jgi:ubiquinone/menaquinone biosynthesis C-methylase UbiE|uniref:class I SAM-dependent methyltransferase n=1 Tax=Lysobacter sp. GCM10012299 TaxID=3317333 RepID=UPI00362033F6
MSERGYQYDFSVDNPAMHSTEGRRRKAVTMLAVLGEHLGAEALSNARILNLGCSTGLIDEVLAEKASEVVGIDIDQVAIDAANARPTPANCRFVQGDAMAIGFADESFDVVICSQVYEHVPDAGKMISEIHRVLVPGGVCYFAATNRLCVVEQHYHLPFLSIVPVPLAHLYLRLAGKGRYYHERHLTWWGLRRLVAQFQVDDYTARLLAAPDRFGVRYMVGSGAKRRLILAMSRMAYWAFPGYVWLLQRKALSKSA